jgi:hypothetical protein
MYIAIIYAGFKAGGIMKEKNAFSNRPFRRRWRLAAVPSRLHQPATDVAPIHNNRQIVMFRRKTEAIAFISAKQEGTPASAL